MGGLIPIFFQVIIVPQIYTKEEVDVIVGSIDDRMAGINVIQDKINARLDVLNDLAKNIEDSINELNEKLTDLRAFKEQLVKSNNKPVSPYAT